MQGSEKSSIDCHSDPPKAEKNLKGQLKEEEQDSSSSRCKRGFSK
jgi:hypothetical protein